MEASYQLKPLINNLNNTSLVTTRTSATKGNNLEIKPILNNRLSFYNIDGNADDLQGGPNTSFSFEDILTDNDKERVDMIYDNSITQGVSNNYSLDLNLTKKDILDMIKYFFSVYTVSKDEAQELKYKIRNYSTEVIIIKLINIYIYIFYNNI